MKQKIVLWGEDENDKKTLIALELNSKESLVNIYTFPEEIATEELYKSLMEKWRSGEDLKFPEGHGSLSRPLSVTDELLPENLKVQRTDLIARAKTEWHFAVLSAKLYEMYKQELEEYKDRLSKLVNFDEGLWNDMKNFWGKVQNQVIEKNLFREQADELRSETNQIFEQLKEKKAVLNEELKKASKEVFATFNNRLEEIEGKIEKGLGLKPIFEELKEVQKDFKDQNLTRGDRNRIWDRLDKAFKNIKEKRFGNQGQGNKAAASRLEHRYNGLLNAIRKMEQSIKRDRNDQNFQTKRIETTDGQLELQIRQAKMKMIEERIKSKEEKLGEMLQTKESLVKKMESEKKKAEAIAKKAEEKKQIAEAKKVVKEKIANQIKEGEEARGDKAEKLKEAAKAITKDKPQKKKENKVEAKPVAETKDLPDAKEEGLLSAIGTTVGESLTDVVDTVKAVASVVSDKVEDAVDDVKENITDVKDGKSESETTEEVADENKTEVKKDEKAAGGILGVLSDTLEDVVEKVKDIGEKIEDKGEELVKDVKENITDVKEDTESKEGVSGKAAAAGAGILGGLAAGLSGGLDGAIDKAKEIASDLGDKFEAAKDGESGSLLGGIGDKISETLDATIEQVKELAGDIEDKVSDVKSEEEE